LRDRFPGRVSPLDRALIAAVPETARFQDGVETLAGALDDRLALALVDHAGDAAGPPYERILREWDELGYDPSVMDLVFHANAERVLGL
jgi:hypothetical protein